MGCYNTVLFWCPNPKCDTPIEIQTKGGSCNFEEIMADEGVPLGDAAYILENDRLRDLLCDKCKTPLQIQGPRTVCLFIRRRVSG